MPVFVAGGLRGSTATSALVIECIRGVVYRQKGGGEGGRKRAVSPQCEVRLKWRRPNLREAGRTTENPMLCYAGERLGVAFCVF